MFSMHLARAGLFVAGAVLVPVEVVHEHRQTALGRVAQVALGTLAAVNILFVAFLCLTHIHFPLFLDLMEGTLFQHFQRAAAFQPIYPEPTPAYVPLAYNSLYYVLAVPFGWVFGVNLCTLRLVAILGLLGSGLVLYAVVRRRTESVWWGLMAAGLFAAAYYVMDTYLDNAHSDSWFLLSALLGSLVIDRSRSRLGELAGVAILVASFWFKQHGALFAIGGLLFLTWRRGLRHSWPHWLTAALLGPVAYLVAGPHLFGPRFLYFTWIVGSGWTELDVGAVERCLSYILRNYPFLALAGTLSVLCAALRDRRRLDIWQIQFAFAALTGFMGALDPGSADNVFIPMGTWFILMGVLGLHTLTEQLEAARRYRIHLLALAATFAVFAYNPREVVPSPLAPERYADLVRMLRGLDGPVYAPSLGQLPGDYGLYPAAHWVALEDMVRGPGRDTRNHPLTRHLLEPALHPAKPAYLLTNHPIERMEVLRFLKDSYVLQVDFGDRFKPLRVLPKRFNHGWPRYLYRFRFVPSGLSPLSR